MNISYTYSTLIFISRIVQYSALQVSFASSASGRSDRLNQPGCMTVSVSGPQMPGGLQSGKDS